MKVKRNLIRNILTTTLSISLSGCLSVDEMLACKDPGIHRRGEERAIKIITDPTAQSTKDEKLALIGKLSNQDLIAQAYLMCKSSPELQKVLKEKITDEEGYAVILLSRTAPADERENALTKIKSDALKVALASALVSGKGADETSRAFAQKLVSDLKDDTALVKYLIQDAKKMSNEYDDLIWQESRSRSGGSHAAGIRVWLENRQTTWIDFASNLKEEKSVKTVLDQLPQSNAEPLRKSLMESWQKASAEKAKAKAEQRHREYLAKRQKVLSQLDFTPYIKRALGPSASDDEKNMLLGSAEIDDKIIIGMTINDLSQTLGEKLKTHDRSSTRFYTTFDTGHTDLQLYTANSILCYINRVPCDMSSTHSYSIGNEPYHVWVRGHVVAISGKEFAWTLAGTYNFTGVETRLPSSFFSLEGMRLGMMKHETKFVEEFVWPFYNKCNDTFYKTLPSYKKSALHAIFPNLTLDWSDWMRSFYGPDSQPVDVDLWNDQVYWIARHYSQNETKKVGGYAGLTKRLTEKLGCAAQKKNNPASANDWGRPSIKPLNFDIRFDPCLTWEIPEKDIRVELREIHSYDKTTVPVEPDKIACDLIISSLSLIRAQENQKKAAAESASAGF